MNRKTRIDACPGREDKGQIPERFTRCSSQPRHNQISTVREQHQQAFCYHAQGAQNNHIPARNTSSDCQKKMSFYVLWTFMYFLSGNIMHSVLMDIDNALKLAI